jgi:hypothetical protein
VTNLANALASAYPAVAKVLCLPANIFADACRPARTPGFRFTKSGWLQNHFLERWGGVGRTLRLKHRKIGGDGARLERLEAELTDVFQAIVVLSNDGAEPPGNSHPKIFPAPVPGPAEISVLRSAGRAETAPAREVIFFGTPFLLVRNIDPRLYAATLNGCLDFLRRTYGPDYRLIYRPHPAETIERRLLRLRGFVSQDDLEVAELFLLKNRARIAAVYSVASTVSRTALQYGLNAYALWRCFPFVPPVTGFFESLLGRVPAGFEIRTLDEPPIDYAHAAVRQADFAARIHAALQSVASPAKKEFATPPNSSI